MESYPRLTNIRFRFQTFRKKIGKRFFSSKYDTREDLLLRDKDTYLGYTTVF